MDPSTGLLQEISSHSLENMLVCSNAQQDRKPRPQPEQALKCPRCDSTNTKFCYYNNYSLSQPRYFCKSCRRYWTKGGTLRNVPVGGGCRKNKRSSSSSASSKRPQDQPFTPNPNLLNGLPALSYDSNDLTLAISRLQNQSSGQMGYDGHDFSVIGNPSPAHRDIVGNHGFVDALRSGFLENQNNLQSFYYGYRNGEFENGNSGTAGVSEEMMLAHYDKEMSNATSQAVTVKQEMCSARDQQSDNRVLWGFPWQFNGEGNIPDFDSGRGSWNSFNSSWHGLLNSPLM